MKKLVIIGNGFDLWHNLRTGYNDFKEYIEREYKLTEKDSGITAFCPDYVVGNHGEEMYDEKESVRYLYNLLCQTTGGDWNNLEDAFGNLYFEDDRYYVDMDDNKFMHNVYNNEDSSRKIVNFFECNLHKKLLIEWFKTIDTSSVQPKKEIENIIDKDTIILNFNYTDTVEKLYKKYNEMLHIHGTLNDGMDKIVFGFDENKTYELKDIAYMGFNVKGLDNLLKKNTLKIISDNILFFNSLKDIKAVYTIGFGYGECDKSYIRKIVDIINKNVIWNIRSLNVEDADIKKLKLIELGFKGKINNLNKGFFYWLKKIYNYILKYCSKIRI